MPTAIKILEAYIMVVEDASNTYHRNERPSNRNSKYPLTLHPTGQYCKKIRGKIYYFGKDKAEALRLYHEQASSLHTGRGKPEEAGQGQSLRALCNLYLDHQDSRAAIGEISHRHFYDLKSRLREFAKFIGPNEKVSEITTLQIQGYRQKLIKAGKQPDTINTKLSAVKSLFNWASENSAIDHGPNLKAIKKVPTKKTERQTFTQQQVRLLLEHASTQMRAMILLGLNCGFGCTDCAELRWVNLDLERGRVNLPRRKTGIGRNLMLWPETVEALKQVPQTGDRVFQTKQGNAWVRDVNGGQAHDSALSKEFTKLLRRAGIETEKGVGFYTLRRTAATVAAEAGDVFAVQGLLGHADTKMASVYVQTVSEQTDRAVGHTRDWLIQQDHNPR
jgi:integrase